MRELTFVREGHEWVPKGRESWITTRCVWTGALLEGEGHEPTSVTDDLQLVGAAAFIYPDKPQLFGLLYQVGTVRAAALPRPQPATTAPLSAPEHVVNDVLGWRLYTKCEPLDRAWAADWLWTGRERMRQAWPWSPTDARFFFGALQGIEPDKQARDVTIAFIAGDEPQCRVTHSGPGHHRIQIIKP